MGKLGFCALDSIVSPPALVNGGFKFEVQGADRDANRSQASLSFPKFSKRSL